MDFLKSPYCKLCHFLLSALGLWPYQRLWNRLLFRSISGFILISATFGQTCTLFTYEISKEYLLATVPVIINSLTYIAIFFNRYACIDKARLLLQEMQEDWNSFMSAQEFDIMHKYAEIARKLNIAYATYTFMVSWIFTMLSYDAHILDLISPLNESRPRMAAVEVEFFVFDQEEYFESVLVFVNIVGLLLDTVMVANQLLFMICVHHACGLFAILGYRLEEALSGNEMNFKDCKNPTEKIESTYSKLVVCVNTHLKATKFAAKIESCYDVYFLLLVTGNVLNASLLLVDTISATIELSHRIIPTFLVIGQFFYIFFNSYMGQKLMDMSETIPERVYSKCWYGVPVDAQKLLLLMMLRGHRSCSVSACKLYVLSMKNFSAIIQTTLSYCMVFREIQ